jgi:endo-alpha-1,4-polygalactosaminidase (GH114 family)
MPFAAGPPDYHTCIVQLGVDGVFSDFVEGVVFYLRFARQNADFPKRQVRPLACLCREGLPEPKAVVTLNKDNVLHARMSLTISQISGRHIFGLPLLQIFPKVNTATNAFATA